MSRGRVTVVMITMNRRDEALSSVAALRRLPDDPPVVVVDNASSDGTAEAIRERFPEVSVVPLTRNLGAAGRNIGVDLAATPYVAFCDDDSGWMPGALRRAASLLDAHPDVGLLAARLRVEPSGCVDPVTVAMERSPLGNADGLPGPRVLGFLACAAVVRREAFLAAGGFDRRFGVGGEEALLAVDLATEGWQLVYAREVNAHHAPSTTRDLAGRRAVVLRNDLWFSWLRRPLPGAVAETGRLLRRVTADPRAATGVVDALIGLPWVIRERRVIRPETEAALQSLSR